MDRDGKVVGETFADQVNQAFDNLEAVAAAAGTSLRHAVRLGVFLRDMSHFASFNEVAADRLAMPFPARTTVPAALPGFDVEIEAVIWIPDDSDQVGDG
jgi:enamine deaminase RidA (YjgF/YER057c/UK114 family)